MVYRAPGEVEHVAMIAGELDDNESAGDAPVLCRIHSECLTSEVLGSVKCDCKQQLDAALERIATEGRGVVLYLRQEGRGIGLGNKVRAYALQEQGHDTVDANRLLGLPDDARDYGVAAFMLQDLGVSRVALMTNNPAKVAGLETYGIRVATREEHIAEAPSDKAVAYLDAKRDRMGHALPESGLRGATEGLSEAPRLCVGGE